MNMNKKLLIPLLIVALTGAGACKKWLDVQPRDKVSEEKLFTTEQGFYSTLNSIYLDMTQLESYGGQLTMELIDIMAHQYNVGTSHKLTTLASYGYSSDTSKARFNMLWRESYQMIATANKILSAIDDRKSIFMKEQHYRHVKGEAYAMRAFLHFDMLRVFGPVYVSMDSLKQSIPYNRAFDTRYQELLPANQVIDRVLSDLDSALVLLHDDPIIANGPLLSPDPLQGSNFWRMRSFRMNYYAVKALQARVHLYRLDKPSAMAAAQAVISAQPGRFPLSTRITFKATRPTRIVFFIVNCCSASTTST